MMNVLFIIAAIGEAFVCTPYAMVQAKLTSHFES